MKRPIFIFLISFFLISLILGIIVTFDFLSFLKNPPSPEENLRKIFIAKGDKITDITFVLKEEGIINRGPYFMALSLYYKKVLGKTFKSGEYYLSGSMSPLKIIEIISEGKVIRYQVMIPEGFETSKIAEILAGMELINQNTFLSLFRNKEFINQLGLTGETLEGYLFPSTYYFSKGMKEEVIIKEMVENFKKKISPEMMTKISESGYTLHEITTIASMIEKETSVDEERPLIAAVFFNRIKKNILLQCDPTVIYALKKNYNGKLTKEDLSFDSPYNTYKYPGLPPGPISNPGFASLKAAVFPNKRQDLLFFVLKDNGRHFFSSNYNDHYQAVRKYRLGLEDK